MSSGTRCLLAGFALALAFSQAGAASPRATSPSPFETEGDSPALSLFAASNGPAATPRVADFENRAILLCWHSFLGDPSLDTDFSRAELAAQLDAIRALGYRFVSLADLLAGRVEGPLNVVATIDDGHRTVPLAVESIFLPRGIRPALFVYPAIIGAIPSAMDDAALRRMADLGCLVGAHGYHHLYVTENLYRNEPAEFDKEIFKAKSSTEKILKAPVLIYAYPFGAYSPITVETVEKAGYAWSIAVKPGFVYADGILDQDYELPRYVVTRAKWKEILALLERNAESASALASIRKGEVPSAALAGRDSRGAESCLLAASPSRESR
jgi:peptidoglycan/xylan/chitin deacetylase (PgdA/CDA1 family)